MRKNILVLALVSALANQAHSFDLKDSIYEEAGLRYNIDPTLLYAIAFVESAVDSSELGMVNPYPWALRTDKPFYGKTRREAEIELRRLLKAGRSVDIGLMQINSRWHKHRVTNVLDLLDSRTNVMTGAQILSERLKASPDDSIKAVANYHSFDPERGRWYARHVFCIWQKLKEVPK